MADQELLIVVRMRDEASAVLAKVASAVGKVGSTSNNALGPTNALTGAVANQSSALKSQTAALQQTANWAGIAKQAFTTLSSGIISATSNAAAISNMANAGLNLGQALGGAAKAAGLFTPLAGALGPATAGFGGLAASASRFLGPYGKVAEAYLELIDAAEKIATKHEQQMRRLTTVAGNASEAKAYFKDIVASANEMGIGIDAAMDKFVKFGRLGGGLGVTARDMVGVGTTAEKLTYISGASKEDADAADKALRNMLSSAKVEAADLRAILDSVPQIAETIARGLGMSVGELRQMVEAGRLTRFQVFEGLQKQAGDVNGEFEKLPETVERSKQRIANTFDDMSRRFSTWIDDVNVLRKGWSLLADVIEGVNRATTASTAAERLAKLKEAPEVPEFTSNPDPRARPGLRKHYVAYLDDLAEAMSESLQKDFAAIKAQAERDRRIAEDARKAAALSAAAGNKTATSVNPSPTTSGACCDQLGKVAKAVLELVALMRSSCDPATMKLPACNEQRKDGGPAPLAHPPPPSRGNKGVPAFDATKYLRDELARLNTTLKALPEGLYAVRKAEMELKASGVGSTEADLLRKTFDKREEIASRTAIDNLKEETELTRRLTAAIGDVNKQKEIRENFEIAKRLRDVAPENRAELEKAIRDGNEARKQNEEADKAAKEEQGKMERATAFARETFKGFFSDLKDGLKKGQGLWEAFGNAARNALNKITEKIVDLVSNKLLDQLFEGLGSAIGLGGSGKGGGAGGGGGGSGIFDFIGKGLKALATFLPFADGGIMTSRGPVPLRKYSGGGIATSPQLALFGEGSVPEAYVPVPSGRIPVELRGGGMRGGMTVQTNISVNMAAPADGQGSGGRGGNMMEQARELGAIVTAMVNKNLQDQMRPGGLLNPSGSFSAGVVQ